MTLENQNFTHQQDITSNNIEVISYQDEEENTIEGKYFYQEEKESFDSYEDFKSYLYFKDEQDGFPEHLENGNGMVILRAPTKFSWGVILGAVTIAFNIVVSGTAVYFYQANFNEKLETKMELIERKLENMDNESYSKREEDLRHENIKLEIAKQNEIINILSRKVVDER